MPLSDGYTEVPPGKLAAVVTYLQMLQPPARSDPASNDFELRRISSPDLAWYRSLFRKIGENWLWFSRLHMSDAELLAILGDPAVDVFVLTHAGIESGFLELDRRQFPDIELAFFGVVPELIGKGAGRFLIAQAIDIAWAHQPNRFWVHTCTLDHPRAVEFYMKSGFVPYKRSIEIADDPRLTGQLPRSAAPQVPLI